MEETETTKSAPTPKNEDLARNLTVAAVGIVASHLAMKAYDAYKASRSQTTNPSEL